MNRPWLGQPWPESFLCLLKQKTNAELISEFGFERRKINAWRALGKKVHVYSKTRGILRDKGGFTGKELPVKHVQRATSTRYHAWVAAFETIGDMYRAKPAFRRMSDRPTEAEQTARIIREAPRDDVGMSEFWKAVDRERQAKTA